MLRVLCIIAFFACLASSESDSEPKETLQFAIVVFRHGEKSPIWLYPTDPHRNVSWAEGQGALTQKGARQAYDLGVKLHKRYRHLLPSTGSYSSNELYVKSSAIERCLMSAQSVAAGLLPPNKSLHQLPIEWQPVPINSAPTDQDNMLSLRAACPKYDELFTKMQSDPPKDLRQLINQNSDFFEYISKHSGYNFTFLESLRLYETLSTEKTRGLELPQWTALVFPEKLREFADRTAALFIETDFMARIRGGPLVTDVLDKMTQKSSNQLKPDRKLFIYSGHDMTLMAAIRCLGLESQTSKRPEYTAALVFELHHNADVENNAEVKINYKTNSESDFKAINIPNCESPCSLADFGRAVEPFILRDFKEACRI